jgi:hypothetical protein
MKKHLPRASSNAAQAAQGAVDAVKDAATDTSDRSSAHIALRTNSHFRHI